MQPQSILPPPLPARLTLVMRLRGWVVRVSKDMVAALQLADPANFEAAAQALLERLPELPQMLTPRQAEQLALGWGTETDAARLMLACWDATEHIVGRYQPRELEDLAASGRLPDVARQAATDTAKRLKLGKLRARFVELYVADVRANPSSLAALARLEQLIPHAFREAAQAQSLCPAQPNEFAVLCHRRGPGHPDAAQRQQRLVYARCRCCRSVLRC